MCLRHQNRCAVKVCFLNAYGYLAELLSVLKNLSVVILVGKQAQRTKVHMDLSNYKVLESYHPSPLVKATAPDKWCEIGQIWKKVQDFV